MTAGELHRLALSRNATLRANHRHAFPLSAFRRWLDAQVSAGLLIRERGRYRLSDEGLEVALALTEI